MLLNVAGLNDGDSQVVDTDVRGRVKLLFLKSPLIVWNSASLGVSTILGVAIEQGIRGVGVDNTRLELIGVVGLEFPPPDAADGGGL